MSMIGNDSGELVGQDYSELFSRSIPEVDTLRWTFPGSIFAGGFASVLLGTPAACLAVYAFESEWKDRAGGDVILQVSHSRSACIGYA